MENIDDIINREFPQNCGDSLLVLEKTNLKKGNVVLFKCKFQKYPYEILAIKGDIKRGSVLNPQIEQVEFIDKIWLQNCGDSLKIIKKEIINNKTLFECEFIKYPYKVVAQKSDIIKGKVNNPQIEKVEFINKIHFQNCGDYLKVIKKSDIKQNGNYLWECEFQKYPYKCLCRKAEIISGEINNPQIEQVEFINKIWPQNCGDSLRVIGKTKDKINNNYLFECEFIRYKYKCLYLKQSIINGTVDNPALPWKNKNTLIEYIKENFLEKPTLQELAQSLNIAVSTIGHKINDFELRNLIKYNFRNLENDIREYINNLLNIDINKGIRIKNNNKQYEIDIFCSEYKVGFEVNGSYWHSEINKDYLYHQEKSLLAQEKGIQLVHIFEYEWQNSIEKTILKSLIKSKLGIFDKKIPARKCIVKEISVEVCKNFCEKNHLQNYCAASIKLGLFYKDELVQIMSFGVPRFTDKYEWEIIRECSKLGYIILGGKEKLWKYFVNTYNPNSVISYCDFSKFTGNSYLNLGFKKERLNKPGFVWWDENTKEVFWRNPYKHKEMKEKGYLKIFDAGQLVFIWNKL